MKILREFSLVVCETIFYISEIPTKSLSLGK